MKISIAIICLYGPAILHNPVIGQNIIIGKIINAVNGAPVPYASIGISKKAVGAISDSSGSFTLQLLGNIDFNDTAIISSIGYAEKKWPLRNFILQNVFSLDPVETVLNEVKVGRFTNNRIYGAVTKKRNLNSGWSGSGKGGEIGNVFKVGAALFKIEAVSFYVLTGCDTSVFKLHIREVANGHPGNELLNGNIILVVTRQDGVTEHDLSEFNILITDHPSVYVSLELVARSSSIVNVELGSNVHITGHRGGALHYKWYPQTPWLINPDYELSLKLKAKY